MRRRLLLLLAALVPTLLALFLLGAAVPRPLLARQPEGAQGGQIRRVLLLAGPIHTDVALPADPDVLDAFGFLRETGIPYRAPGVRWLALGWGGREFYTRTPTWDRLEAVPLLKGLTLDRAAMHVQLVGAVPLSEPGVLALELSPTAFRALLQATLTGFARDDAGRPVPIPGSAYGDTDAFFEAEGRFTALMGCNTWAGQALRAAGIRTGMWNPVPQSLFWSVRRFNSLGVRSDGPAPSGVQPALSASKP